ncbi:hypothetical protein AJ80_04049 [Polytolypa hystricis UAMH7299]|uniref:DNA primase n=1 Tax=Polytolypa hystricis (strain UAMH7299) TaxID=1447883 RepID=A0A2B7YCP4_POLH7|nr:hypothetical protein AJ80_04049 [Polytolypa hystricis UAMH7299]
MSSTAPSPKQEVDSDIEVPDAPTPQPEQNGTHGETEAEPKPDLSDSTAKADVKLEDLFNDDDDEDEEFPDSSAADTKFQSSPPPMAEVSAPSRPGVDEETMYAFYSRLFPFRYLFQWLNHGVKPSPDFANREFAFTLQNDAYLRYQAFPTSDLLRRDILRLNPSRFEIGPVYSTNPRDRKILRNASSFKPVAKELVFDIDLTDYDEIRTCCTKANICEKCWQFVTMAIKVIDVALRDDFGFEHILWVYSGRRGAHAWVCDQSARNLPDDRRRAIAGYLELVRGGSQSGKKVNIKRPLHPHIARSLEILKPYFANTILTDQAAFTNSEQEDKLLSLLPNKSLNAALRKKWDSAPDRSSTNKWADIDSLAKTNLSNDAKNRNSDTKALLEAKQDIVLEYTYPRLDAEVSKKLIHLLKSPFVVHPGTGRVCVPIDVRRVDRFDPLSVPTVSQLLSEINEWDRSHPVEPSVENGTTTTGAPEGSEIGGGPSSVPDANGRARRLQDYEKTSLKPYIDYFRGFIAGLLKEERAVKREREDNEGVTPPVAGDGMEF